MRKTLTVTALILLACNACNACNTRTGPSESSEPRALLTASPPCAPNDGLDDRACIQEMIDTACAAGGETVRLEAGKWNLSRPASVPGNDDNASLWIRCEGLALEGEDSAATTLMMTGDGYGADWSGVRIAGPSARISISKLTIASDEAYNVNEQTHTLMLGSSTTIPGAITNVQLHDLRLRNIVRPEVAGDCLRMVGEPGNEISFVDAYAITFEQCDRSGWAVQRGNQDDTLHDSSFIDIGKTAIDMEPSGTAPIRRIRIANVNIHDSGISISGSGGSGSPIWTEGVVLADSQVGGRVGIIYSKDVTLEGVQIFEVAPGAEGTLNIRGSQGITVTGGSITRLEGSAAGPAVKISGVSGTYPNDLTFTGVRIASRIAGHVVDMESVQDVTFTGNLIAGMNAANTAGISARATGRDISGLLYTGNTVRSLPWAFSIAGSPSSMAGATLLGNVSSGSALRCDNVAKFTAPVVIGNYYAGSAPSGCTLATLLTKSP